MSSLKHSERVVVYQLVLLVFDWRTVLFLLLHVVIVVSSAMRNLLGKVCVCRLALIPVVLLEQLDYTVYVLDIQHSLQIHYCHPHFVV